jgi:hypothetical protein
MKSFRKVIFWSVAGYFADRIIVSLKRPRNHDRVLTPTVNNQAPSLKEVLLRKAKNIAKQKWNQTVLKADAHLKQS